MKKHYKTLGLKDGASQEEIQTTYERLSKELDPKKNDNQEFFVEEYKKVQEAYKALSNSSILATQGGAHKNDLDQLTPSKKMDIPTQVTKNRFTFLINRKRNIISTNEQMTKFIEYVGHKQIYNT
jgi:DnaJ-class molecular chaperone